PVPPNPDLSGQYAARHPDQPAARLSRLLRCPGPYALGAKAGRPGRSLSTRRHALAPGPAGPSSWRAYLRDPRGPRLRARRPRRIAAIGGRQLTRLPLHWVRIADFTWIGAGSFTTKLLADHGADVIKLARRGRMASL